MSRAEKGVKKFTVLFAVGGALYALIEILWRGYTHPSMGVCGGLCLCGLYSVRRRACGRSILVCAAAGSALITLLEFTFGCICNCALGLGVWDYSDRFANILGQVCLLYTALWFGICFPAFGLCRQLDKYIFGRW